MNIKEILYLYGEKEITADEAITVMSGEAAKEEVLRLFDKLMASYFHSDLESFTKKEVDSYICSDSETKKNLLRKFKAEMMNK